MSKFLSFVLIFIYCTEIYAEDIKLVVVNDYEKPITIVKNTGEHLIVLPNKSISSKFQMGSTLQNYIDGKHVCDWDLIIFNGHKIESLVYGWFGSHPSHLDCAILYR